MKKLLTLLLVAVLLLPTLALAEGANEITFDENNIANVDGEFYPLDDFELMFFLPSVLVEGEVTDDMAAQNVYAVFTTAEGCTMSIGYGPAVDGDGNAIDNIEDLCAYFVSNGLTNASVGAVNGIKCIAWSDEESNMMGTVYLTEANNQLAFNFSHANDETFNSVAALVITSVMPLEYAEE